MNDNELNAHAQIMKALANPVRLKIVKMLSEDERCICELQPLFNINKSTISRHVAVLSNAGILHQRREGVRCYLKLATPCILEIFPCVMVVLRAKADKWADIVENGESV